MAVAVPHVTVNSSVCAVYTQNWQIPNPSTSVTRRNYFHSGRSLNKDWIQGRVKHIPHQHRQKSACRNNGRSKTTLRSPLPFGFLEQSDDEINDTVKEFKLTLQLFKRLTQQVQEVNQCMNNQRIYSFKHHMNNGIASPALRRSQLAVAMSKREIPATEAAHEPCNDLGPSCSSYLARPCSRQERRVSSPVPLQHPSSSVPPSRVSSPSPSIRPSSRSSSSTKRVTGKTIDPKKLESGLAEIDLQEKQEWQRSDPQFIKLFVPDELSPEDYDFRFHDPYPQTWVDETIEGACFRGSKKIDPFMYRLKELEDLKEETVLWEMYKDEKVKEGVAGVGSGRGYSQKLPRQVSNGASNSRTQSAKVNAPQLYRAKSVVNRLKRYSSAGKTSSSNHVSPVSDDGSDSVVTFRNSGYQMGISFIPGSLYPEARFLNKVQSRTPSSKSSRGEVNSTKRTNTPHAVNIQALGETKKTSGPKCEACSRRPTVTQRASFTIPRSMARSIQSLRNQYALKASECYDIVELARTFDPPCKSDVKASKKKNDTSATENAANKGIKSGKSYFSQRRISLTRLTPDESIAVRGVNPLDLGRTTTGRCKSAKRRPKRR